jgi:hypothetical protein
MRFAHKTRKSGTPPVSEAVKNRVCTAGRTEKPEDAAHCALAKRFSPGKSTVNTILRGRGIQPYLEQGFRFSTGWHSEGKLTGVAGLYMNPPDNAIALCAGGKSRIQALGMLTGNVTGECKAGHNGKGFIEYKPEETKKYLGGKAGRFVPHFIPAHSSWLNMAERRFGGWQPNGYGGKAGNR